MGLVANAVPLGDTQPCLFPTHVQKQNGFSQLLHSVQAKHPPLVFQRRSICSLLHIAQGVISQALQGKLNDCCGKHFEPPLRHFTLQAVSTHEVASIVDRLLYKPSEANHAFTAIRTFLRWATKRRYISHSPCEGLELPARVESRDRVLTDEEISIVNRQAGKLGYPFGTIVATFALNWTAAV